jgi:hypothetical protein
MANQRRMDDRRRRHVQDTTQRDYSVVWQVYSRDRVPEVGHCQARPCPYPDAGTARNPLTTDHAALGLVLCRRCNSAKQHADRAPRVVGGRSTT